MRLKGTSRVVGAAFAAALALAAALPCAADTHTVSSIADDGSAGTLRYELSNAVDYDTIDITAAGTILLTGGQLSVDKSVTITGPGQDLLTVDGGQASRVFHIAPGETVTISGLTIANGAAGYGYPRAGGGIWIEGGVLTLSHCTLKQNVADLGGAVFNEGALTLTDCTLNENTAFGRANYDNGENEPTYGMGGAIFMHSGDSIAPATLTLERCTLSGNLASGEGGIAGAKGGAIWVGAYDGAPVTVTVTDSTLVDNAARGSRVAEGGAMAIGYVEDWETGATVIIRNSTLTGNSALGEGDGGSGGAISHFNGSLTVDNSTLTGNSALALGEVGGGMAGAIVSALGELTVDNSTLTGNYDDYAEEYPDPGFSGILNMGGSLKIKNTILANAPSGRNLFSMSVEELGGSLPIDDLGFNLCTDDCSGLLDPTTNLLGTDPLLGPLADNGGLTQTHALLADSPAIDAADSTDSAGVPVDFDQRGVARPQGSYNDIGAFESECGLPYSWSGVLQPVDATGGSVFKAGSTVPVKFRLTGCSAGIVDLQATLSYNMINSNVVSSVNESVSTSSATTGNLFRYDPMSDQYLFNWSTKDLSRGTYRLFIDLGDGVEHTVEVGLR